MNFILYIFLQLPSFVACCGFPLRIGALLAGIIILVLKIISVGTELCLIDQDDSEATGIFNAEYIYTYYALIADVIILLFTAVLQCGIMKKNPVKIFSFVLVFAVDWIRLLLVFLYEFALILQGQRLLLPNTMCGNVSAYFARAFVFLNLYFLLIINSYHTSMLVNYFR